MDRSDLIFIGCMTFLIIFTGYLMVEEKIKQQKELEFINTANCSELSAFIKDGLINGSKSLQQKAESYYLIECQEKLK